jgi:hypothetical protein
MTARDDLATLVKDAVFGDHDGTTTWHAIADTIIAAGWREPFVEALDRLQADLIIPPLPPAVLECDHDYTDLGHDSAYRFHCRICGAYECMECRGQGCSECDSRTVHDHCSCHGCNGPGVVVVAS